ncbi:MAG TPA: VanZ family protein, partial [Patescibacteria group bacterium]|nr:VanZ family protein [Patescibacteria group bacterium]
MVRRILPFLAPVLWMVFIFFLSSQPVLPGPNVFWQDFLFKKSAHIIVYTVLFFLWYRAFSLSSKKKLYMLPFLLTL